MNELDIVVGGRIDGFAVECGPNNKVIIYKDNKFLLDRKMVSKDEYIEYLKGEYTGETLEDYINKIEESLNTEEWLSKDEMLEIIKNGDLKTKILLARYTNKCDSNFIDQKNSPLLRKVVALTNPSYHNILKDDPDWTVRVSVAIASETIREEMVFDDDPNVRGFIAGTFPGCALELLDDPNDTVREAAKRTMENSKTKDGTDE